MAEELTEGEIAELKEAFSLFDLYVGQYRYRS